MFPAVTLHIPAVVEMHIPQIKRTLQAIASRTVYALCVLMPASIIGVMEPARIAIYFVGITNTILAVYALLVK